MAFGCHGTENAEKMVGWRYGQKAKADERRSLEAAASEIRIRRLDGVVETKDLLMQLLTPQMSQSPKGGIRRRRIAGRGLVRPSACGSGVSATSPSVIAA